ncbi:hypothetical protein A2U01_0081061, partial [Trifolium medium]|nr:hypothetical protein [Trifolium medium]
KERVRTVVNPMTTEEGVILAVEGSQVTGIAIGVVKGVICLMIARGMWTSVSSVES